MCALVPALPACSRAAPSLHASDHSPIRPVKRGAGYSRPAAAPSGLSGGGYSDQERRRSDSWSATGIRGRHLWGIPVAVSHRQHLG